MSITVTPPSMPKGLLKWAFLLPRYLYRCHLGWLLGHRALMVTQHLLFREVKFDDTGEDLSHL
jgi:hypothetical protein